MDNLDLFVDELMKHNNLKDLQNSIKAYNQLPIYFAHKYKTYIENMGKNYDLGFWKPFYLCLNVEKTEYTLAIDFVFSLHKLEIFAFIRRGDKEHLEKYKDKCAENFPFANKRNDNCYEIVIENIFDQEAIQKRIDLIITTIEEYTK